MITEPEPLTDARLAEIEARCASATPGPWVAVDDATEQAVQAQWKESGEPYSHTWQAADHLAPEVHQANRLDDPRGCIIGCWYDYSQTVGGIMSGNDADKEFIAHARADVPDLIAEIRRLRADLALCQTFTDWPSSGLANGQSVVRTETYTEG